MPKQTQQTANYRRGGNRAGQCGKCTMYRKSAAGKFGTCTAVTGQITPFGVCNLYQTIGNPFGRLPHHEVTANFHHNLARHLANPY